MKKIYDRLRKYSTFAQRTRAAYQRLKELTDDPDYSADTAFVARFLSARDRLRKSATIECVWRRMYELDRYGLALALFEENLEALNEKRLNAGSPMVPYV
jgi:hypothetical protein